MLTLLHSYNPSFWCGQPSTVQCFVPFFAYTTGQMFSNTSKDRPIHLRGINGNLRWFVAFLSPHIITEIYSVLPVVKFGTSDASEGLNTVCLNTTFVDTNIL